MAHDRQVPLLITLRDFSDNEIRQEAAGRGLIDSNDSSWFEQPSFEDDSPNPDAAAIFEALYCGNEAKAMELMRAWVQNETGRCLP